MGEQVQVVMLGSGHPHFEDTLKQAQEQHPDFFRGIVRFSEELAHRIVAASDILLMPSRFEPCGLNQMYALRYGTVPVACATGGLRDTIEDVSPFEHGEEAFGTGWTFSPATAQALVATMKRAVSVYRNNPRRWRSIQVKGMEKDFGWSRAARSYEEVIRSTLPDV
jgi:starch synthase